jgi:hypothetical protein
MRRLLNVAQGVNVAHTTNPEVNEGKQLERNTAKHNIYCFRLCSFLRPPHKPARQLAAC